jgi:alpha,alpha-trehalose-phosphate synthase [UDP-forming]
MRLHLGEQAISLLRQARRSDKKVHSAKRLEKAAFPGDMKMAAPSNYVNKHLFGLKRLVVVSNRLPFRKSHNGESARWTRTAGGLVTAFDLVLRRTGGIWLGWNGERPQRVPRRKVTRVDLNDIEGREGEGGYSICEIPLSEQEVRDYYTGFSNSTLWPLFHYFFEKCDISPSQWECYKKVNRIFAKAIAAIAREDDLIWVQDYHLLLVPQYVHELRPELDTHLFIHIPFPHHDILTILPWHKEILQGMTHAASIGFHDELYLGNFLTSVQRSRVGKVNKPASAIRLERRRKCSVYAHGISIDYARFNEVSLSPIAMRLRKRLRKRFFDKKIVLGVDRLDYSKGIRERLMAIEHCLQEHPELLEKFYFYQIAVPSRITVPDYADIRQKIESLVGRVNGRFSTAMWTPVHYFFKTVPMEQLVATYLAADVALVTPLRDGMNLVAKEYVASHSDEDGVLVLSRFAGAARELKVGALLVNPYSIEEISRALYQALTMDEPERHKRMVRTRRVVQNNDINNWLTQCWESMKQ